MGLLGEDNDVFAIHVCWISFVALLAECIISCVMWNVRFNIYFTGENYASEYE